MIRSITEFVLDGYPAGELDFTIRLSQAGVETADLFEAMILQPVIDVLSTDDQSAVLTITGHSDRVDTEGLTREQRRQREFEASDARAVSAREDVVLMVTNALPHLQGVDFDGLAQIFIADRPAGAAVLRESASTLTEAQRRRNRRVQMRLIRFEPV
jgi:hypothetical protein